MNASSSHETATILKEKTQFLREDNKNKSIVTQNLPENRNLLLRNKVERNIQYKANVNDNKRNFPSDEILIPYNKKMFKNYRNTGNNIETNNLKLKDSSQALATANDIDDTIDDVSDKTLHLTANERDI